MPPFDPPARLLMGPGPSPIHPDVLAALAKPTLGRTGGVDAAETQLAVAA